MQKKKGVSGDIDHIIFAIKDAFQSKIGFAYHQFASYEKFVEETAKNNIHEIPIIKWQTENKMYQHTLIFGRYSIGKPCLKESNGSYHELYPDECIIRGLNYNLNIYNTITYQLHKKDLKTQKWELEINKIFHDVLITELACMKRSKYCNLYQSTYFSNECPMNPGGIFIIKGNEKFIVGQMDLRKNYPFISLSKNNNYKYQCEYRMSFEKIERNTSTIHLFIKSPLLSILDNEQNVQYKIENEVPELENDLEKIIDNPLKYQIFKPSYCPEIDIALPFITKYNVTVVAVLFLLGCDNRKQMIELACENVYDVHLKSELIKIFLWQPLIVNKIVNHKSVNTVLNNNNIDNEKEEFEEDQEYNKVIMDGWTRNKLFEYIAKTGTVEHNHNYKDKKIKNIKFSFNNEFLPNLGNDSSKQTRFYKIIMLLHLVKKLTLVNLGKIAIDDQDHLNLKRGNLIGPKLAYLFRFHFRTAVNSLITAINNNFSKGKNINIASLFDSISIKNSLQQAFATGNWNIQKNGKTKGVAQQHIYMTIAANYSNLRKFVTNIHKESKLNEPRELHKSHYGMICPVQTPDGKLCGLLTNLSLMSTIRHGYDINMLINYCLFANMIPLINTSHEIRMNNVQIIVNGAVVGYTNNPFYFLHTMRQYRNLNFIPHDVGITWVGGIIDRQNKILRSSDHNYISINADFGAFVRIVFCNKNLYKLKHLYEQFGNTVYFWDQLMIENVIVYLDMEEQEDYKIAESLKQLQEEYPNILDQKIEELFENDDQKFIDSWISLKDSYEHTMNVYNNTFSKNKKYYYHYKQKYTHCEIHPQFLLSVSTSQSIFPEYNQSPRNTFNVSMSNQAMVPYSFNKKYKLETSGQRLLQKSKPLVRTQMDSNFTYGISHGGKQLTMALITDPYVGEDATVQNKNIIDFGAMRSVVYRTVKAEIRKKGKDPSIFEIPDPNVTLNIRDANYSKLQSNGIPKIGTVIKYGDAIVGRTIETNQKIDSKFLNYNNNNNLKKLNNIKTTAANEIILKRDNSIISKYKFDNVVENVIYGENIVRIILREIRIPKVADKFTTREGQKGVIGSQRNSTDMPYFLRNNRAITVDMIMNPHAMPSRMTVGQILEMMVSKNAIKSTGKFADGTPWNDLSLESQCNELEKAGFDYSGKEWLYNGATGEMYQTKIFVAPVFVQRLKHVVDDKFHYRQRGPENILTHQPLEGRVKNGGLKIGEMESETFEAYGATYILKERLFDMSDPSEHYVCSKCGLFAEPPIGTENKFIADVDFNRLNNNNGQSNNSNIGCYCNVCQSYDNVCLVQIPNACVLAIKECYCTGIVWRLKLEQSEDVNKKSIWKCTGLLEETLKKTQKENDMIYQPSLNSYD